MVESRSTQTDYCESLGQKLTFIVEVLWAGNRTASLTDCKPSHQGKNLKFHPVIILLSPEHTPPQTSLDSSPCWFLNPETENVIYVHDFHFLPLHFIPCPFSAYCGEACPEHSSESSLANIECLSVLISHDHVASWVFTNHSLLFFLFSGVCDPNHNFPLPLWLTSVFCADSSVLPSKCWCVPGFSSRSHALVVPRSQGLQVLPLCQWLPHLSPPNVPAHTP